jgi:N-acetylglucosaminyldiphosphoundecaprenol N-acetyl-beta-D-mannosaminyltransferase
LAEDVKIPSVTIGPLHVDSVTRQDALDRIEDLVRGGQGGYVVTPNVDHIVLAQRNAELREAYRRAALSLADGQPVLWMARLLGSALPEKVSGSDFIDPLMAHAARQSWRVFLFGANPAVSMAARAKLLERHPALQIVGADTSLWQADEAASPESSPVVEAIRRAGAQLVIVALGNPKQELWMLRHAHVFRPAVAVGLGGSLDFVGGAVRRAPRWMSKAGVEWLYRLIQEPRRLAYRYLVRDAQILPIFAGEVLQRARASGKAEA